MNRPIRCMKEIELFSGLSDNEKEMIPKLAKSKIIKKDETLFNEGSPCDSIYLICSGKIALTKYTEDGKKIILDIVGEGCILGETTIFDDMQNTFYAVAMEEVFCCVCHKDDFLTLLGNPLIAVKIIAYFINKLNSYTERLAIFTYKDVKNRVFSLLSNLADKYSVARPDGQILDFYLSHEDISNMAGASRVMVTNVINDLKSENLIGLEGRRYIVKKPSVCKIVDRVK